jgi:hypothetical protein
MKTAAPLQREAAKAPVNITARQAILNPLQLKTREEFQLQMKQNPLRAATQNQNPLQLLTEERTKPDSYNPLQLKENKTGLPDKLKAGVEALSGYRLDDVRVHYNSDKPIQLNALAYAQGTDIHIGPGQEKHLPHEAWHVVQQKQGRVRATININGDVSVNNNKELEREANAERYAPPHSETNTNSTVQVVDNSKAAVQMMKKEEEIAVVANSEQKTNNPLVDLEANAPQGASSDGWKATLDSFLKSRFTNIATLDSPGYKTGVIGTIGALKSAADSLTGLITGESKDIISKMFPEGDEFYSKHFPTLMINCGTIAADLLSIAQIANNLHNGNKEDATAERIKAAKGIALASTDVVNQVFIILGNLGYVPAYVPAISNILISAGTVLSSYHDISNSKHSEDTNAEKHININRDEKPVNEGSPLLGQAQLPGQSNSRFDVAKKYAPMGSTIAGGIGNTAALISSIPNFLSEEAAGMVAPIGSLLAAAGGVIAGLMGGKQVYDDFKKDKEKN